MSEAITKQIEPQATMTPGTNQVDPQSVAKPRRRYIKVDVSEEVFVHVHDMANKSRMRLLPYLRRFLEDCCPFATPGDHPDSVSFESDRTSSTA